MRGRVIKVLIFNDFGTERLQELESKLLAQHDIQYAVERRVEHDQKVTNVQCGLVRGLEEHFQVFECD